MTTGAVRIAAGKKKPAHFFKPLGKQYQLMIMSVPMFLYVCLFNYGPLWGWLTAFQDYQPRKGLAGSKWIGLKNFEFLFTHDTFLLAVRNTLAMSLINLVFGTVSAILLAILLNEVRNRSFKRTVQTVTYLPHFVRSNGRTLRGNLRHKFVSNLKNQPANGSFRCMGKKARLYRLDSKLFFYFVFLGGFGLRFSLFGGDYLVYFKFFGNFDIRFFGQFR